MTKLRLKFSKHGPVRFVGHLDLMRYFQKVMRRAGVDIAYSEGYSPHQLMSFAQPLPAGATSDGEYMDISLNSFRDIRLSAGQAADVPAELTEEDALRALVLRMNAVMKEGIQILDAQILTQGAEKAMTAVSACRWRLSFYAEDDLGAAALRRIEAAGGAKEALSRFLSERNIRVVKKTKKTERELDLRPLIYEGSALEDGSMTLLMKAGSTDNVKPALFAAAFLVFLGEDAASVDELSSRMISALMIHREETYLTVESEGKAVLQPLIASSTPSISG